jgi:hypothetical protein
VSSSRSKGIKKKKKAKIIHISSKKSLLEVIYPDVDKDLFSSEDISNENTYSSEEDLVK